MNRRSFDEHLPKVWQQALRDQCAIAILMIDIDHFKRYNDTHGHLVGDATLRSVAKAVQEVSRRPLDLAARYGGEEFAVILYGPTGQQALEMAERLCVAVRDIHIDATEFGIPDRRAACNRQYRRRGRDTGEQPLPARCDTAGRRGALRSEAQWARPSGPQGRSRIQSAPYGNIRRNSPISQPQPEFHADTDIPRRPVRIEIHRICRVTVTTRGNRRYLVEEVINCRSAGYRQRIEEIDVE